MNLHYSLLLLCSMIMLAHGCRTTKEITKVRVDSLDVAHRFNSSWITWLNDTIMYCQIDTAGNVQNKWLIVRTASSGSTMATNDTTQEVSRSRLTDTKYSIPKAAQSYRDIFAVIAIGFVVVFLAILFRLLRL